MKACGNALDAGARSVEYEGVGNPATKESGFAGKTIEESARCAKCGVCCRTLYIFATPEDLAREPQLMLATSRLKNRPDEQAAFGEFSNRYLLAAGWAVSCPMLGPEGLCTIYETRPDACRQWQPERQRCERLRSNFQWQRVE